MATDQQINANRENAQHSTGPRSDSGNAISARNALTLGLFTATDYVRADEQAEYDELCVRCVTDLNPLGFLEDSFVTQIVSAHWRLRRCALLENQLTGFGDIDPMADQASGRIQTSVDRARSQAFNRLHRATVELRRLQTDRAIAARLDIANADTPLADQRQVVVAIDQYRKAHQKSASFCRTETQMPRNALCTCGSGKKYKRCCGKLAPPVLSPGSGPSRGAQAVRPYPHERRTQRENPGQAA